MVQHNVECHVMTLRLQVHPSLGALTRAALRCSEELTPFLQPCKLAYVFGPLAAAAARGTMWLLPGEGPLGTDQHLLWRGAARLTVEPITYTIFGMQLAAGEQLLWP